MESLIEAIKKPHDKLFRDIFSIVECAVGFLRNNLAEKYLKGKRDGQRIFEIFLRYLISTTDNISINEYKDMFVENLNPNAGECVMTLADKLIQEGKIEGKVETMLEVAMKMLKEGVDKLLIAKITELPLEKIEQLQTES